MAKKNLIIGGCTYYGINQLKPWVLSVLETMPDADKVLCVGNITHQTRIWLNDLGFTLIDMPTDTNIPVHVLRFLSIHNFLKDNYLNYNYVVTTDVKDVIFQSDPFEFLTSSDSTINIIAGSESIAYQDEPWGDDNLKSAYGPYVYEMYKDKIIYNVGTIGGQSEYVKDLIFNIFTNAINRPIPIVDQAVFNVLIASVLPPFPTISGFSFTPPFFIACSQLILFGIWASLRFNCNFLILAGGSTFFFLAAS